MADWVDTNVFPGAPEVLQSLLEAAAVADGVVQGLQAAEQAALNLTKASMFLGDLGGSLAAAVSGLESALLDLLAADMYMLPMGPQTLDSLYNGFEFTQIADQLLSSSYDTNDPERPQFSEAALTGGIVVLAGAETLVNLKGWIEAWIELFDKSISGTWMTLRDRITGLTTFERPPVDGRGTGDAVKTGGVEGVRPVSKGVAPDWSRASHFLIPSLDEAVHKAKTTVEALSVSTRFAGLTDGIEDVIRLQGQAMADAVSLLQQVRAAIQTLQAAGQGVGVNLHLLAIPAETGGVLGFIDRLEQAGNRPLAKYLAGPCILVGGPDAVGTLALLQASLGMIGGTFAEITS